MKDSELKKWLKSRDIKTLEDLQNFMMYSFLGSITNHNVRHSFINLSDAQLSKMMEYYCMSVFGDNHDAIPIYHYQKRNYEDWKALHYEYDDEYDDPDL